MLLKYSLRFALVFLFSGFLFACSSSETKAGEKTEIIKMDSTEKILKQNKEELEKQTKEVEESLEKLDKDFEENK